MAEVKTEQEPSIEEILESIRQIISEDTEEAKKPEPEVKLEAPKEAPTSASSLSLKLKPEAPVPPSSLVLKPEPAPAAPSAPPSAPKPVEKASAAPLDLTEKVAAPPPEPAQAPITIEMMDSPMTDNDRASDKASSLMSPETATAVTDSLSKLLAGNVAIEAETGRAGKVTLEEMARDLMKPLIKMWLDQNLPGIIEKAVQKEVEKLSRRAMDR
jgi:cell pole-organizing protein PopZ